MAYKARFRPLERLGPDGWQRLGTEEPEAEDHRHALPTRVERQRLLIDA